MKAPGIERRAIFKRSARARHLRIRVSLHRGVIVTVPPGISDAAARSFLLQHEDWVRRALRDLQDRVEASPDSEPSALPEEIALPAIGLSYPVRYRNGAQSTRVRRSNDGLVVHGDLRDPSASRAALKRWLLREGRERLPDWLDQLSRETGLDYGRVSVRAQRGRWGSCTSGKTISLNCKLLFLPPVLVQYVLVHELAHTVHLDHSPRFWALVSRFVPDYKTLERELRRADTLVPGWAEYLA